MTCLQAQESMGDHSVGLLDPESQSAFEEHVAICAECARSLREFRRCLELLDHMPRPTPPPDLWIGMRARLDLERSLIQYASAPPAPAPPVATWWSSAVAALGGFAAAAGLLVILSAQPSGGPSSVATVPPSAVTVSRHSIMRAPSPMADGASMIAADGASMRTVNWPVQHPNVILPGRALFGDAQSAGRFGSTMSGWALPGGAAMADAGESHR